MHGVAETVDKGYREYVYHGKVSCGGSKGVPVVILRDTGSIQTLMVGDPKSLPSESNTGRVSQLCAFVQGQFAF